MTRLSEDMARWEAGDLLLAEVAAAHPDDEVHALAELHSLLCVVGEEDPLIEAAGVWTEIRGRLHGPPPARARLGRRMARPMVAAAAAVLLLGGIAYAAGLKPVHESVNRVVRVVKSIFDGPGRRLQVPGDAGPTGHGRKGRSEPGGGTNAEDPGHDNWSGPGGGGGSEEEEGALEEGSGPGGGGDDPEDEPDEPEGSEGAEGSGEKGPDHDDSSGGSSNSGSGSGDDPEEKDDSEGPDEADD